MITVRYQQRSIYEPLVVNCMADYKELLWEGWLLKVDQLLEDENLVKVVREALEKRHPHSRTRGRLGTPAEVVLRLMALKHLRNWSYQALEREVRANVMYREFTRIRGEKVPDCKTMVRWGKALASSGEGGQASGGYDCGRDRHSLSDRQWVIGGCSAGIDAHDEADRAGGRQCRDPAAGSNPQCKASTDRDWALGDAEERGSGGEADRSLS
jgi:Transposase domain (DUF772)